MGHLGLRCGGVLTILNDIVPLIFAHVIAGIGAKCLISSLHVSYCLYGGDGPRFCSWVSDRDAVRAAEW